MALVVGPSGCGKSTLLNLIGGFEAPTSGTVTVAGQEVLGPGADRAMVFQRPALYPWLTIAGNIAFGLRFRRCSRSDIRDRVDYFLDRMGLEPFRHLRPYQVSGGMQQRVAMARALVVEPSVLLMDEPFGALDALTRSAMQAFLLELWQDLDVAVVFVTHDVAEAILLGDRVVVMTAHPGRILCQEKIALQRPRNTAIELSQEFVAVRRHLAAEQPQVPIN
ncbi:MAG: ABC transporter ATP-binding protein [Actinomycetota bacterium]|nr:ABC transporter ATP-binding protein [Actinomycetota bacterium]